MTWRDEDHEKKASIRAALKERGPADDGYDAGEVEGAEDRGGQIERALHLLLVAVESLDKAANGVLRTRLEPILAPANGVDDRREDLAEPAGSPVRVQIVRLANEVLRISRNITDLSDRTEL